MAWIDSWETPTYLDSKAFRKYAAAIDAIIHQADRSVSIADIHRQLGDKKRIEWTADAIDSLRNIEPVGILPTRYRPRNTVRKAVPVPVDYCRNYKAKF